MGSVLPIGKIQDGGAGVVQVGSLRWTSSSEELPGQGGGSTVPDVVSQAGVAHSAIDVRSRA